MSELLDATLPHNLEAEREVLGAALAYPGAVQTVRDAIPTPDAFFDPRHRAIYQAMLRLLKDGAPVDLITVEEALAHGGKAWQTLFLDNEERLAYLQGLALVESVANLAYHATEIEAKARLRRHITLGQALMREATVPGATPEGLDAYLAAALATVAPHSTPHQWRTVGSYLDGALSDFTRRADPAAFVPWPEGWHNLADRVPRGLLPGLHVLVGSTGSGKTQLALQLAHSAALAEYPVLYLALEADAGCSDMTARLMSLSGVRLGWSEIYKGEAIQERDLDAARAVLEKLPLYLERSVGSAVTAKAIADRVTAWRDSIGASARPGLVVLDYVQRVTGAPGEDRRTTIGNLSATLRRVSTDLDCAVLAISSTAREGYGKLLVATREGVQPSEERPGTGDASRLVGAGKESGELEYDADTVLVLAKSITGATVENWVAIAKQRAGRTGWAQMNFNGHRWQDAFSAPEEAPTAYRRTKTADERLMADLEKRARI